MKNKEKYAKEIVELVLEGTPLGFHKDLNKIIPCYGIQCQNCLFNGPRLCSITRREWANAEYEEPKIFTEREKAFIKLFPEIQYIARDEDNRIFGHLKKPIKDEVEGWWVYVDGPDTGVGLNLGDLLKFESIRWEDEKPTSREEILRESNENKARTD